MAKDNKAKVALLHDELFWFGGAERVLLSLIELFPEADIYSLYLNKHNLGIKEHFKDVFVNTSFWQKAPYKMVKGYHIPIFKVFSKYYWENIDLSSYDLVISSSSLFNAKAVICESSSVHIAYIHTPPRYLYFPENRKRFFKLESPADSILRNYDFLSAQRPDVIVSNSKIVQKRIWKYYRRTSELIYPPAYEQNNFKKYRTRKHPKYYLAFSRLEEQKGIDLVISTCSRYNLPLIVVGVGTQEKYLRSIAGKTVKFAGYITETKLKDVIMGSKALLYGAKDEDFGMIIPEVMSYGLPVVAYASGGILETIVDGETGVLYGDYSAEAIYNAISKLDSLKIQPEDCVRKAKKFSKKIFQEKFISLVEKKLTENKKWSRKKLL